MTQQQNQLTNDFAIGDFFSENGVDAGLSAEREKDLQILNLTTECRHWQKKFEGSKAKVATLQNKILKIMEGKGVLGSKISCASNLVQGYLKDFPLTNEIEGLFKSVLRVLEPDPYEFTNKGPSAQQKLTSDTRDALSSVEAGSSRGISNTGAQNYVDIPTRMKRRQVSVGNEVFQKKVRKKEHPGSCTLKMNQQIPTRKHSKKSSVTKAPSKTGERSTGDVPPQIQTPHAPLGSTSGVNNLDDSGTRMKQRQVSVRTEVSRKKICRKEPLASSTSKMRLRSQTQKHSNKPLLTKTPSKIGESGTEDVPPQIQSAVPVHAPPSPTSGVSNTGTQNCLGISTRMKQRQVSVGNEIFQRKVRRKELPDSSTSKMTLRSQARKYSNKSSVTKVPSKTDKRSTGDVPPQIQTPLALLSPTSGLQSTTNTRNMKNSKSPSAAEKASCAPRDTIAIGTNPLKPKPAQSRTLSLVENCHDENDDLNYEDYPILSPDQIEAKYFCMSRLKNKNWDDDSKAIINKLCLRLRSDLVALKLAIAYINEDLLVPADPLKDVIENYIVKINNYCVLRSGRKMPGLVKTRYLTWRVSCEKIRETPEIGEKALKVMHVISFLPTDNIRTQFVWDLYTWIGNEENSGTREKILQLLRHFSVVNSENLILVDPLIQQAIRIHLEEEEKLTGILRRIQSVANKMINENSFSSEKMAVMKAIWEHSATIRALIEEHGRFPISVCWKLVEFGKYREAFEFSCRALPVLESNLALGGKHRWTLRMKYWRGSALFYLCQYVEAMELLSEVYETQKEIFGEEDGDCLDTATRIGLVHWKLEKHEEALKCFHNALEKRERIFGVEHPRAITLKHNIALVLDGQGKHEEAMELYLQVLEVNERMRGEEHPETLTTRHNVAVVKFRQGEYEEAFNMFQQVLQTSEKVLEFNHPKILLYKNWADATYRRLLDREHIKLFI